MEEHRKAGVQHQGAAYCSVADCLEPVDSKGFCSKHYFRDYYHRNKARRLAQSSAYRLANPDRVKATKKAYYATHKDEHRIRMNRWREQNREKNLKLMRNWNAANRDRRKLLAQVRAGRLRDNGIYDVTTVDLLELVRRQDGRCAYCGRLFGSGGTKREWDHVTPISKGGRHSVGNIVAACHDCNASKGASYVTEWRMRLARSGRDHS